MAEMSVVIGIKWAIFVSCHWNKVGHLHQLIGDSVDGIEATRSGEFTNKVQLYPLPWAVQRRDRLELTKFLLVPVLRSATSVAPMYIAFDPIG
jgi:hypothetical protein